MQGHDHMDLPSPDLRGSHGSERYRRRYRQDAAPYIRWDSQTCNWCSGCQVTLLDCYHTGCPRARDTVATLFTVAAEFGVEMARAGHKKWHPVFEDIAYDAGHHKAFLALTWSSTRPENWPPPNWTYPGSIVTWLATYVSRAAQAAIGAYIKKNGYPPDSLDEQFHGSDGETFTGREPADPGPGPEELVEKEDTNTALTRDLTVLLNRMLAAVAELPTFSQRKYPAARLLLEYYADFNTWESTSDSELATRIPSDRDIAKYLGIGNSTVSNYRRDHLTPALTQLLAHAPQPHLTSEQYTRTLHAVLGDVVTQPGATPLSPQQTNTLLAALDTKNIATAPQNSSHPDTGPTIAPLTARQTTALTQFLHSLGKNQVALPPETPSENTTPPPTSPPTHEADPR